MKKIILHTCILGIISFFAACDTYDNGILNDVNQSNPTTITLDATNITNFSAVVSGKINMEYWDYIKGNNSYCGVFYSTCDDCLEPYNYGCLQKPYSEIKANDIAEEFSVTLSELEETETYYYRAFVCVNDVLYRLGEVKSFTTTSGSQEIKSGKFSISSGKYINFSPGNLQYNKYKKKWRFASKQYNYIGDDNKWISSSYYEGWIDLFSWGTGDSPEYYTEEYLNSTFVDWGSNEIGDYEVGTWRTLTINEWEYILSKRPNASSLKGVAQVAGTNGLILLPDNWECPNGITFNSGFGSSYSSVNNYSASEWAILESSGAVFLPAGGYRYGYGYGVNVAYVEDVQKYGYYWTSNYISCMDFGVAKCSTTIGFKTSNASNGASVRLAKSL